MKISTQCDGFMASSSGITKEVSLRLSENSIERVINLSMAALRKSSHQDAMTAHDDLEELGALMTRCWYSVQQAVLAATLRMHG